VHFLQDQTLALLRDRIADIIIGTVFLFGGLSACAIAAMRRRSGVRALIWLGIWSAMYGARPLADSLAVVAPRWFQVSLPYLDTLIAYLTLVVALLPGLELSRGKLRVFYRAMIIVALPIGLAGILFFIFTGSNHKLMPYNNLLAACSAAVLLAVVAVPGLYRKYFILSDRGVLLVGTLVFAIESLYVNLVRPLGFHPSSRWDTLGFAFLLLSLAYAALRFVFANERRLLSIEKELEIAREIQTSILPSSSPETKNLCIAAAYHPMTAVAGDFYDFIPLDQHRVGVLVADVSGHGVPAALIAAMIKMGVQSIVPCVQSPGDVLRGLNRMLSGQAPDQFVTAAYLFIDTQNYTARYSAAGHPPLLLSRAGTLHRIESNGLVFGVTPQPEYPVRDIAIRPGDRLLLYTDGVIESENAKGEQFGGTKLEEVVLGSQMCTPSELTDTLLTKIRAWQPTSNSQQDDITLVVIDVR